MVTRSLCLLFLLALSASAQTPRIWGPEHPNNNGLIALYATDGRYSSHQPSRLLPPFGPLMTVTNPISTANLPTATAQGLVMAANQFGRATLAGVRSISFRVRLRASGLVQPLVACRPGMTGGSTPGERFFVYVLTDNKIRFAWGNGTSSVTLDSPAIAQNKDYFIVQTISPSSVGRGYIQGEPISGSASQPGYIDSSAVVHIGDDGTLGTRYIAGTISRIAFWSRELSPDEIKRMYRGLQ